MMLRCGCIIPVSRKVGQCGAETSVAKRRLVRWRVLQVLPEAAAPGWTMCLDFGRAWASVPRAVFAPDGKSEPAQALAKARIM